MSFYPQPKLNNIASEIVRLMPPVRDFFESDDDIETFSKKICTYSPAAIHLERQKIYKQIVKKKIGRILPKENIQIKVLQPDQGLISGVVNHHGLLNDPVLIGVDVTSQYSKLLHKKQVGDILTFSTGNVPIGNPFHRRGFYIDDKKVALFPKVMKNMIVFGHEKYDFRIIERLKQNKTWPTLTPAAQAALEKIESTIRSLDFAGCQTLGDQLTKINSHLWPLLFEEKLRANLASLISVEYDDCVSEFLIHVLRDDPDSFIAKIVLDADYRTKTLNYFEGQTGAWNEERGTGSHLFWGRSPENKRVAMKIEGGVLKSAGEMPDIPLKTDSLENALLNKIIYCNMFLKFSLLIFYMGLKPIAGYGSGNYLAAMQKKLADFIRPDYPEEAGVASKIPVNSVTSIPVLLHRDEGGAIKNYYAFDIIKDGGVTGKYLNDLKKIPVKFFMASALNRMYEYAFNLYGRGQKIDFGLSSDDYEGLLKGVL